jgi:hypothetical protein
VDQEVGGSSPPSCTIYKSIEIILEFGIGPELINGTVGAADPVRTREVEFE